MDGGGNIKEGVMKNSIKVINTVLTALVFSLVSTVAYGGDSMKSDSSELYSQGIVSPIVMKHSTWEQWPNYEELVSYNGSLMKNSGYLVQSSRVNGPTIMKHSTWKQWPSYEKSVTPADDAMFVNESVDFSFGVGTSVMKESTWEQWPVYDESMTE